MDIEFLISVGFVNDEENHYKCGGNYVIYDPITDIYISNRVYFLTINLVSFSDVIKHQKLEAEYKTFKRNKTINKLLDGNK